MKPKPTTIAGNLAEFIKLPLQKQIDQRISALICASQFGLDADKPGLVESMQATRSELRQGFGENAFGYDSGVKDVEIQKQLAREVLQVPRFTLSREVVNAVNKMGSTTSMEKILDHFDKARPPFNKMWVEWSDNMNTFEDDGSVSQDTTPVKIGFVVDFQKDKGLKLKYATIPFADQTGMPIIHNPKHCVGISGREVSTEIDTDQASDLTVEKRRQTLLGLGHAALCTFLLMNSRSKVIQSGPEVRARGPLNYIEPVGLRPVTFDLSRVMRSHPNATPAEAERMLAEQMVRGHFKVRETGVFFWSPHIRNMQAGSTPEEAWSRQLARPREDVIRHPERELVTPQGLSLPPAIP